VHITVSPLVLLVALAFLVPWSDLRRQLRARLYQAAAAVLRLYLQRRERATVLVYVGQITVGGALLHQAQDALLIRGKNRSPHVMPRNRLHRRVF